MAWVWVTSWSRAEASRDDLVGAGCSSPTASSRPSVASAGGCDSPAASSKPSVSRFVSVSVPPISSSSGSASPFWGLGEAGASRGLSEPVDVSAFFSGDS